MVQSVQLVGNVQAVGKRTGFGNDLNDSNVLNDWNTESGPLHLASTSRIGEALMGDAHDLVFTPDNFAKINVLDRIVCLRHCPGAARTIDFRFFHSRENLFSLGDVAFDGLESGGKQQSGIVTLDRIYVGHKSIGLRVGATKLA